MKMNSSASGGLLVIINHGYDNYSSINYRNQYYYYYYLLGYLDYSIMLY